MLKLIFLLCFCLSYIIAIDGEVIYASTDKSFYVNPDAEKICEQQEKYIDKESSYYKKKLDNDPIQSYRIGERIKNYVYHKDLQGLLSLVLEGSVPIGLKKEDALRYHFDDFFTPEWRQKVLSAKIPCFADDEHMDIFNEYTLGNLIWYYPRKNNSIFHINGIKKVPLKNSGEFASTLRGWEFQGKIIYPQCFVSEWISGDNFEEFERQFSISMRSRNIGLMFGNQINDFNPIIPGWGYNGYTEKIYLIADLELCFDKLLYDGRVLSEKSDTRLMKEPRYIAPYYHKDINNDKFINTEICFELNNCKEHSYRVMAKLSPEHCQSQAPHFPGTCIDAAVIFHVEYSTGTIGNYYTTHVLGIFNYKNKYVLVPLNYLGDTSKDLLNFLDR